MRLSKWILIPVFALAVAVAAILGFQYYLFYHVSMDGAGYTVYRTVDGPTRKWSAVVWEYHGNATVGRNTMLTLNPTFRTFDPEEGVAFLKLRGDHDLALEWKDERTLTVRVPKSAETVFERSPENGIRIEIIGE